METSGLYQQNDRVATGRIDPAYRLGQEVKILYELLPASQWLHLIAAVLLFAVLHQALSQETLFRWFGFFLLVFSLRVLISINYRKAFEPARNAQLWFNFFLVGTALYGVMWSGTAIYLVPSESGIITGFTCLLLCGLASGSVAISSVNLKVFIVYAVSTIWPYAGLLIASGQYPHIVFGWLMLLFFAIIVVMSVQVNRYFASLIEMELRTGYLQDELRRENRKREVIEKALLDNTLEEELSEQIRRLARSLRHELTNSGNGALYQNGPGMPKDPRMKQMITYKPYWDKFNSTVMNQIDSARGILEQARIPNMPEEQQKRISIAEKLLHDVVKSIRKLNIDDTVHIEESENLHINRINLRQLLIYTTHEVPLLYKSKLLTIRRHVDEDIPKFVLGDRKLIRDVLHKLVLNSFQYSDGGVININIKKLAEDENEIQILFEVEDTGVGIPPDVVDRFLNGQNNNGEYTGLAGVRSGVQSMGGELHAKSTLGVGSIIGFTLKMLKDSEYLEI
jgi:signal transduction histidine kinase